MLVNYDEIIDIIKKDKDINFVAFLRTPWHAQGVEATLESLAESESLNGIILLSNGDYNCDKPLVAKESFNLSPSIKYNIMYSKDIEFPKSKIQLLKLKLNTFSYFMHHKKGTRKIYVLSPFAINDIFVAKLKASIANASIINIIIDEGLGTYTRTKFNWAVEHYQNTKSVKRFVASLFAKNIEQLYKNICSRKNELIINNILVKGENKKYIPNNKIISYYKNSLNSAKLNESEYRQYENAVIISAQLYHENNQIKNNADFELYKAIIEKLNDKNIKVVFKPHPRDKNLGRYSSLDCFVDTNNTISQEAILSSLSTKPIAVLSFTSTALVTTKLFCDVDTYSLIRLFDSEDVQLTLQNEFNNFAKTFDEVVKIPNTIDELINNITL